MKNRKKRWMMPIIAGVAMMGSLATEAYAYPMFGKQTGLDCTACHMQHEPKLNQAGRKFVWAGMTDSIKTHEAGYTGMEDINPSIMFKSMYEETWDKPGKSGGVSTTAETNGGVWSVPKTASLLFGGRINENLGGLVDFSYKDNYDNSFAAKMIYANEIQDGHWGVSIYSGADFGPFSGVEVYNTGLYKPLRTFDIRKLSNAFSAAEINADAATGLQLYYERNGVFGNGDHIFVTAGAYAPAQDQRDMNIGSNVLPFARLAYEFPVGGFNLMIGAFGINGGDTVAANEPLHIKRETYGLDLQLEGSVADFPVSLVMSKVLKNDVMWTGIGNNHENPEEYTDVDNQGFSVEGEVNVLENLGLKLAYMTYDDVYPYTKSSHLDALDIADAITVGMDYSFNVYLPMKLAVEHSWVNPGLDRVHNWNDFLVSLNILY